MSLIRFDSDRAEHPVDVVEQMAAINDWAFDREAEDEIALSVAGAWTTYNVAFTWLPDIETLHISCAFDLKITEHRRPQACNLISAVNEQMWIGHFGIWDSQGVIIFRHAMLLAGGAAPTRDQCESALHAAVAACERYYQAFQLVQWAGRSAQEALACSLFETAGEA